LFLTFEKYYLDIQEDQLKAGFTLADQGFAREPTERYGKTSSLQSSTSGFCGRKAPEY
jgi:hypothetical protein